MTGVRQQLHGALGLLGERGRDQMGTDPTIVQKQPMNAGKRLSELRHTCQRIVQQSRVADAG